MLRGNKKNDEGLKSSGLPLLRNQLLICLCPCDSFRIVLLERAFYVCCLFRGLLALGSGSVWVVDLFARLNVGTENAIYNVMNYGARGDDKFDDTQAFASAWSNACKAGGTSTLVIPAGKSFLVTKVQFNGPCNAKIHIQFEGQIVAPAREAWKAGEHLISIEYLNGLTIDGNGQGGAEGDGSTWWQCRGCKRHGVLHFHFCNDLSVSNIKITNSPKSHVSVNKCIGATFSHISIDSPATSPNTDGFDISFSSNILVKDSNIKSGAQRSSEAQGCSEAYKEFRGCLLVMSHSEDEDVHKLNCEGLSEANHSRTNQTPSYQRFIRSKGIPSHQRAIHQLQLIKPDDLL
ncbi:hypothetical protein TSUD_141590 [Trifolium subterraneum]|uniref:Pectate lyase superfamily protein domain-containing protein n=1 Tax=Trifolium subterraneum TaxID=3900 RepID=A0A2Z6P181_TRISU|nr:hypothetical protein TSUD_141590 [Trifolium subterraneum]